MAGSNVKGMEQLDAMIAVLKSAFSGAEYAQAAARSTETWLRTTLAAGQDPNTMATWEPTQEGKRPLKTAATRPSVQLAGSAIIIELKGHYVFQHFPTRGRMARRVIPQGSMPEQLGNAIRAGLVEPFEAKTAGGKRGFAAWQRRGGRP